MRKAERKAGNLKRPAPAVERSQPNRDSCDMVLQVSRDAVGEGPVGSFWFGTWSPGREHRYLWLKLPGGGIVTLPVGLSKPVDGPSWGWDGNEDKPTLTPSVWYLKNSGRPDEWHGWIRAGRMVSV